MNTDEILPTGYSAPTDNTLAIPVAKKGSSSKDRALSWLKNHMTDVAGTAMAVMPFGRIKAAKKRGGINVGYIDNRAKSENPGRKTNPDALKKELELYKLPVADSRQYASLNEVPDEVDFVYTYKAPSKAWQEMHPDIQWMVPSSDHTMRNGSLKSKGEKAQRPIAIAGVKHTKKESVLNSNIPGEYSRVRNTERLGLDDEGSMEHQPLYRDMFKEMARQYYGKLPDVKNRPNNNNHIKFATENAQKRQGITGFKQEYALSDSPLPIVDKPYLDLYRSGNDKFGEFKIDASNANKRNQGITRFSDVDEMAKSTERENPDKKTQLKKLSPFERAMLSIQFRYDQPERMIWTKDDKSTFARYGNNDEIKNFRRIFLPGNYLIQRNQFHPEALPAQQRPVEQGRAVTLGNSVPLEYTAIVDMPDAVVDYDEIDRKLAKRLRAGSPEMTHHSFHSLTDLKYYVDDLRKAKREYVRLKHSYEREPTHENAVNLSRAMKSLGLKRDAYKAKLYEGLHTSLPVYTDDWARPTGLPHTSYSIHSNDILQTRENIRKNLDKLQKDGHLIDPNDESKTPLEAYLPILKQSLSNESDGAFRRNRRGRKIYAVPERMLTGDLPNNLTRLDDYYIDIAFQKPSLMSRPAMFLDEILDKEVMKNPDYQEPFSALSEIDPGGRQHVEDLFRKHLNRLIEGDGKKGMDILSNKHLTSRIIPFAYARTFHDIVTPVVEKLLYAPGHDKADAKREIEYIMVHYLRDYVMKAEDGHHPAPPSWTGFIDFAKSSMNEEK